MTRPWERMVVVCAGTRWDGIPASEHQIAERLARWMPVLYVDPPLSLLRRLRNPAWRGPTLRVLGPNLVRLTPVVLPGMRRGPMTAVTVALMRQWIAHAVRRLRGSVAVRVVASDLPLYVLRSSERRILFATDDFGAGAGLMGLNARQMASNEARLARESELVIAVSDAIAVKWRGRGSRVTVVSNGCDIERFAEVDRARWPDDVRLAPPIAGFAGQINARLEVNLLREIARRGRSVLLVGPVTRTLDQDQLAELLRHPCVQWVGGKEFEAMPSYIRSMHVGLTPYADTPFNRASVPLKTLEYLAAGRGVVSTDLPAARALGSEHVTVASGARAFADAVEARLEEGCTAEAQAARRTLAARHSWGERAREFAQAIGMPIP